MKIFVRQKHIKGARKGDATRCPLARALREKFPNVRLQISGGRIGWGSKPYSGWAYRLPRWVFRRYGAFDAALGMKPFHFVIPNRVARAIRDGKAVARV